MKGTCACIMGVLLLAVMADAKLNQVEAQSQNTYQTISSEDVVSEVYFDPILVCAEFCEEQEDAEVATDISESEEIVEESSMVSDEEITLLALLTMAEAEGECEEGQRLVIDTVLNRVDSPYFPDTIYDVVHQPNQYSSMWNGRVDRCYLSYDLVRLVREELENRTNSDVIFFRTERYSDYGVPAFQVGNHYFSNYE